ncbi:hypothetical protein BU26DRAFT_566831 [Trematosphaeria pertusa]|uniref:DUF6594 domain-containing protein n=1 Tax=Trematosphaeria pertusa TaxID=390896 RepID=A0A6A6IAB9_9PLEO|nr:uncharacterized protein BU26DRAFT_566831 [Trematosphaeria pertusa]KAF2246453.1 hypothetical protein BU26DRAFT_566831 [Trematosphaeria pertusa]
MPPSLRSSSCPDLVRTERVLPESRDEAVPGISSEVVVDDSGSFRESLEESEPAARTAEDEPRSSNPASISPTPNRTVIAPPEVELFKKRRRSSRPAWAPEVIRTLKDSPEGYPRLAAFLDSDENFMVFRRFGYFQNRLLLEKQGELMTLETRIDELDECLNQAQPSQLRTVQMVQDSILPGARDVVAERQQLLERADQVFREYAQLMTAVQQMRSFERPTERDHQSVFNYMWNTKPIVEREASWVQMKEDLVALRPPKEPDWLEARIGGAIVFLGWRFLQRLFTDQRSRSKSGSQYIHYFSASRISNVATAIVAFIMAVILVLPVLLCYVLVTKVGSYNGYAGCIGILFFFTMLFSCTMAFYSKAKRHETLAATAAYCAVLVVFLGNAAKQE